jgi:hypothetical protein
MLTLTFCSSPCVKRWIYRLHGGLDACFLGARRQVHQNKDLGQPWLGRRAKKGRQKEWIFPPRDRGSETDAGQGENRHLAPHNGLVLNKESAMCLLGQQGDPRQPYPQNI